MDNSVRTTILSVAKASVFVTAFLSSAIAHAAFSKLAVLGDSLSDQGRFYEITDLPILGGLPPGITYFDGRFSNGPVWVDYFQAENSNIPVFNRSMGGALSGVYGDIDNVSDPDFDNIPIFGNGLKSSAIGLRNQVASVPNVQGLDVAFSILIGANDFLSSSSIGFSTAVDAVPSVLNNVQTALKELVRRGADHFVLFNLPDLGKTPQAFNEGREAELSQATALYNQRIDELVTLGSAAGFTVDFVDAFSLQESILANPLDFGFTNVTSGCLSGVLDLTLCGDPNSARLFWDTVHPTTAAHALFADLFADATGFGTSTAVAAAVVPLPASIWLFFSACGWLGITRLRRRKLISLQRI